MGWARVTTPSDVVKAGDEVTVKVLKIDEEMKKISLGMKQLQTDPWSRVGETYAVGQVRQGKVVRIQDFGAFVELEPGIEGLAHVSTFAPTGDPGGWKRTVPPGTAGEFEILSVDLERKRIGVAWLGEGSARFTRARRRLTLRLLGRNDRGDLVPPAGVRLRARDRVGPRRAIGRITRKKRRDGAEVVRVVSGEPANPGKPPDVDRNPHGRPVRRCGGLCG